MVFYPDLKLLSGLVFIFKLYLYIVSSNYINDKGTIVVVLVFGGRENKRKILFRLTTQPKKTFDAVFHLGIHASHSLRFSKTRKQGTG